MRRYGRGLARCVKNRLARRISPHTQYDECESHGIVGKYSEDRVYGQYSTHRAYRTCGAIAHATNHLNRSSSKTADIVMSTRPPCIALTSGLGAARGYGPLFLTVLIAFGGSLVALGFAPT